MYKICLMLFVCIIIFTTGECAGLSNLFHRETTTEQPEELTKTVTAATDRLPPNYYKANNIPKVEEGCYINYECKKKLKAAEIPKPCVKFCVKSIECESGVKIAGVPGQCLELNEDLVARDYNDCRNDDDSSTTRIMKVALIDFPCQPGYLPDSRGRCREVW